MLCGVFKPVLGLGQTVEHEESRRQRAKLGNTSFDGDGEPNMKTSSIGDGFNNFTS